MKVKGRFKAFRTLFLKKIKDFYDDEYGGNLVEYALLIGFALFIFFTIVSIVTSMIDWTAGQANTFWDIFTG
jgi:Flp pilus assembly pilin Flp